MQSTIENLLVKGGVRLAGASQITREKIKNYLASELRGEYETTTTNPEELEFQRAFGISLLPFLDRLVQEKPRAAESVVQLALQWRRDMKKRKALRENEQVALDTYVVEPTNRCNLRCPKCYANSIGTGNDIPNPVILQIDREAREDMGATLATISGGEPFLAELKTKTLTELAERAIESGNRGGFLVYTNGTLINKEIAKRLGQLRNIWPAISIEGFPESTKARRGAGIIDQIRRAKDNLDEYGVMYGFSATATRTNVHEIASDKFFEERLADGDHFGWIFLCQLIGRDPDTDSMVTGKQRYKLGRKVFEKQIGEKIPMFIGDFWNFGQLVGGCIAAGRGYAHIMADGAISPCVFSPFAVTHLKEIESFSDFYPSTPSAIKFKNLQDALTNHQTLRAYRKAQDSITDRYRPCVLIDNPELAREVFSQNPHQKTNKTPEDYLQGKIADVITERANEWRDIWAPRLREYARKVIEKRLKS